MLISPANQLVEDARRRLLAQQLAWKEAELPSLGKRWSAYAEKMGTLARAVTTPQQVLHVAQTQIGFEHRGNIHHEGKFTALYERELKCEFPQWADRLHGFADFDDCAAETSYVHEGRPVSNVLFYLARIILSCCTRLPAGPEKILEIGGGYGAPARLWLKNPVHQPRQYWILDLPESLFFAEIILKEEFGAASIHYMENRASGFPGQIPSQAKVVLCPVSSWNRLGNEVFDLVINTGSMQEMSEEWIDFYQELMDVVEARWFYSLNYFAQPISSLWESGNLHSPRLGQCWQARFLNYNPAFVRMQADRNYLEAIYEKIGKPDNMNRSQAIHSICANRLPAGGALAELMEHLRFSSNPDDQIRVLEFAMGLRPSPKEALWLAQHVLQNPAMVSDPAKVRIWHQELSEARRQGVEGYY